MAVSTLSHYRNRGIIALVGVTLVAEVAGVVWFHVFRRHPRPAPPPMRIVLLTNYPGHQRNPSFSPDGNRIAFVWDGEKAFDWHIYVGTIGAKRPRRLTSGPGRDSTPVWSPDGRYIAFYRDNERDSGIYAVPAAGGSERKLHTPSLGLPGWLVETLDWSPDGKYLAFVDRRPNQEYYGIFLLAVDNPQDIRPLTTPAGMASDAGPSFSPDGKTVAFNRSTHDDVNDIFLARLAGGEPERLTFDHEGYYHLNWTPDGAYIVCGSDRLGNRGRLWKVSLSSGQVEPLPFGQGGDADLTLSRDGRRLAYTHFDTKVSILRYEIPRTQGQSAPPTELFTSMGAGPTPQYSPDGKRIAFQSSRTGTQEIWVCDSDGSNPRQLTFFNGPQVRAPRWSPDSREIVFEATPEGHGALYVVSAEGGQPHRLPTDASYPSSPSWSRDGKWIYFTSALKVWKMPAGGGQAVQVTKDVGGDPFESPDGKALYYLKYLDYSFQKIPVAGGEERLVFKLPHHPLFRHSWALTGEGIYFYDLPTRSVEFFNFDAHRVAQIFKPSNGYIPPNNVYIPGDSLAVSPNGRWILMDQLDDDIFKIMLVENFRW